MRRLNITELELVEYGRGESGSNFEQDFCNATAIGGVGYVILTAGLGIPGVNVFSAFFLASQITCKAFGY